MFLSFDLELPFQPKHPSADNTSAGWAGVQCDAHKNGTPSLPAAGKSGLWLQLCPVELRQASLLVQCGLLLRWMLLLLLLDKDSAGHDVVANHELVADWVVVGAPADHIL